MHAYTSSEQLVWIPEVIRPGGILDIILYRRILVKGTSRPVGRHSTCVKYIKYIGTYIYVAQRGTYIKLMNSSRPIAPRRQRARSLPSYRIYYTAVYICMYLGVYVMYRCRGGGGSVVVYRSSSIWRFHGVLPARSADRKVARTCFIPTPTRPLPDRAVARIEFCSPPRCPVHSSIPHGTGPYTYIAYYVHTLYTI